MPRDQEYHIRDNSGKHFGKSRLLADARKLAKKMSGKLPKEIITITGPWFPFTFENGLRCLVASRTKGAK